MNGKKREYKLNGSQQTEPAMEAQIQSGYVRQEMSCACPIRKPNGDIFWIPLKFIGASNIFSNF